MGSPISPGVADLTMEDFEEKALSTAPTPPKVWYRYVDDTFTVLHQYHIQEFTDHINSQNPHIKFTIEEEQDGQLPFLDTCVCLNDDGTLKIKVYRKPTHTDQYLNWESNHHLEHKRSVVRTLLRRAETLVTEADDKQEEIKHVKKALTANGYRKWSFKLPRKKEKKKEDSDKDSTSAKKFPVALPYVKGLSEQLQRVFKTHDVPTFHKPFNTLRSLLVRPKDKSEKEKQCGLVYSIKCKSCEKEYIGETARSLGTRFKEHTDGKHPNSAVNEHTQDTGHLYTLQDVKVLKREERWFPRKVREAIVYRYPQETASPQQRPRPRDPAHPPPTPVT